MNFTSSIFLVGLLPWFVILSYLTRKLKFSKKILLLIANTVFYLWGGTAAFVFTFFYASVVWALSVLAMKTKDRRQFFFAVSIVIALLPLFACKYVDFILTNINAATGYPVSLPEIVVPVGISFYTFEAISLLCDIRKKECDSAFLKNKISFLDVYLYLTFFPTVTSGPILRFGDFESGLKARMDSSGYTMAVDRIIIGLCKKTLLADKIALLADYYFDGIAAGGSYSALGLWIGSIAYTLQLYFDFSGYSDMAIGIGCLLGFHIPENFNNPYQAKSISDFWKRWHISLSRWFRDYVYIPLGGNRCSKGRHVLNLLIVWLLTGIWHGADWSFLLWGAGYFVLLTLEKYLPVMKKIEGHWYGHLYALLLVNFLWVPFRSDNLSATLRYFAGMFGYGSQGGMEEYAIRFLPLLLIAICACLPWKKWLQPLAGRKICKTIKGIALLLLFIMSVCAVVNASYTPYIYGNF